MLVMMQTPALMKMQRHTVVFILPEVTYATGSAANTDSVSDMKLFALPATFSYINHSDEGEIKCILTLYFIILKLAALPLIDRGGNLIG